MRSTKWQSLIKRWKTRQLVSKKLVEYEKSYLQTTGWLKSLDCGIPCDSSGCPLPWMNYPFIAFLETRIGREHRVFEFGAGFSTIWFGRRVKNVISAEGDQEWADRVMEQCGDNVEILVRSDTDKDGEFVNALESTNGEFDVIVIDGSWRYACMQKALECTGESGVIILDDSNRSEYSPCHHLAQESGFRSLTLRGLKPLLRKEFSTTVFYRDRNCIGL